MDFSGKKVLVTGADGMVGRVLVDELINKSARIKATAYGQKTGKEVLKNGVERFQGDLKEKDFCKNLAKDTQTIFHLASARKNIAFHREHSLQIIRENVAMSEALIEAAKSNPQPVVFVSTANITPDMNSENVRPKANNDGYIIGKLQCEQLWQKASLKYDFPLLIIRPVNIYGPGDRFASDGNVIPALIIKAQQSQKSLLVWGSGKQERSFLYVEDAARTILLLAEKEIRGLEYLHPKSTVTIADLAKLICREVAPQIKPEFDLSKPEGIRKIKYPPVNKALSDYPWTGLKEGLRKTVAWLQKQG